MPRSLRLTRTWQIPVLLAALAVGLLLMAIQLWILTVSLDLLLSGRGQMVWQLAVVSGAVFAGGVFVLRLLRHGPPPPVGPPG